MNNQFIPDTPGTYLCSKCGKIKKGHICTAGKQPEPMPQIYNFNNAMSTRRTANQTSQYMQQYTQQQQQQMQQQQEYEMYSFLQLNAISNNPTLNAEQRVAREKAASEFNSYLLLERQERYPFYFDPHSKTIQVISSWEIAVSEEWKHLPEYEKTMINKQNQQMISNRYMYLQQQQDLSEIQKEWQKTQQKEQREMEKYKELKEKRERLIEEAIEKVPKPKSNVSAFFHYMNEFRDEERRNRPDVTFSEISKILSQKWKVLTEEEKQKYHDRAREDKIRHEAEYEKYQERIEEIKLETPPVDLNLVRESAEQANNSTSKSENKEEDSSNSANPAGNASQSSSQAGTEPSDQQPNAEPFTSVSSPHLVSQRSHIQEALCEACQQPDNKINLLSCCSCNKNYHGKCLQLHQVCIEQLKKFNNWKCIDCKVCESCNDSGNEEKMLFCDVCDKGYHTFCLNPPLNKPPTGGWKCSVCVFCSHCGAKTPGSTNNSKWKSNYTCCESCFPQFGDKSYCPVCRKIIKQNNKAPLTKCLYCERSVHNDCDANGIQQHIDSNTTYKCPQCKTGATIKTPKPLIDEDEKKSSKRATSTLGKRKKKDDDDDVNIED
ncbi:hypothetical protein CYY_002402 [Polysphondylium violaceum]|uniref:PHD zinc finger-containing protein n=1 Tax=Polysphondylium violaceum TaxID=133409 RepID=A0A8J4Q1B6_9MYCE|nr:hypothetical protein CYY_002402 [Polysphondylium violaceum]